MRGFSDLPPELIKMILPLVQPEDSENFAQVSKTVQAYALPLLVEYREHIQTYSTLSSDGRIPEILEDIFRNPRLGRYVREIHVAVNDVEFFDEPYTLDLDLVAKAASER